MMSNQKRTASDIKFYSSFDREERVGEFKTDAFSENIIDVMNDGLFDVNRLISSELQGKSYPSIVITGAPRSGTTLISQLLPARYDMAYVSNLMARFYNTPLMGAWLQQQLIANDIQLCREFSSQHGVTKKIFEPHEFGFFWSHYFVFNSDCHEHKNNNDLKMIDFALLDKTLSDISTLFQRPVIYKCSISPFIIKPILQNINVFFIHITRDRSETINSILKVREERLGSEAKWWGIRPLGWNLMKNKDPKEQVGWQYDKINEAIKSGSSGFENRVFNVSLEELIKKPEQVLKKLVIAYSNFSGYSLSQVGEKIIL